MKQNISSNKALVSRENFAFHSHARKLSGQPGTFLMYSFLLHFRIFEYPINANDNSERGRDPLKSESRLVAEGTNSERRVRWNRKLLLESTILDTIHERERETCLSASPRDGTFLHFAGNRPRAGTAPGSTIKETKVPCREERKVTWHSEHAHALLQLP